MTLRDSLLATISWFDLWQYPLTTFECWYFLWDESGTNKDNSVLEVLRVLESMQADGIVRYEDGFWLLAASPSYVSVRLSRARYAITKLRLAKRAARLIMHLPFIRFVGLGNTLAFEVAKLESDIDLFIIIKQGRLFLGRLLVTALVQALGWRRHGSCVANRLCLSFYIADDALNLKPLAYADDPYLAYWLASLYPLEPSPLTNDLMLANVWVKNLLPNRFKVMKYAVNPGMSLDMFKKFMEWLLGGYIGDVIERLVRKFELFLIHSHQNSRLGDGTPAVVVNNSVLKFHESDQRAELAVRWRQRWHGLIST